MSDILNGWESDGEPDPSTLLANLTDPEFFHVLALKGALHLELAGMKRRGRSAYAIAKAEFGLKGNKQKVYDQLVEYCAEELVNRGG